MSQPSFKIDDVISGKSRLSEAQALELYHNASMHDLGSWASAVTQRLHPEDYRTYVIDRNINYTNVCTAKCTFCAFRRDHEDSDAYTLNHEQIGQKIKELVSIGGTQILMQGGMNDRLPIEYYEDLLRYIKTNFPTVHIHAFSPPEFVEFERFFGMDVRDIIRRFKAAGLATIPGGGGEIFAPRVRKRIGLGKCTGDDWLRVMRVAHEEGMNTSCTMLIGHIEFIRERIEHMSALRDMQDYSNCGLRIADCGMEQFEATRERVSKRWPGVFGESSFNPKSELRNPQSFGSYTAFIHWPFQRENTPLGHAQEWEPDIHGPFDDSTNEDILKGRVVRMAGADEYLRMLGIARLFFDNIPSLQSSWVTMGPKIGQLAMFFGANDMGSVMMEENVVSAAGTTYRLNEREICRLIRDAGWIPAQRDQYYNVLKRHDDNDSPDLRSNPDARMRSVRRIDKQFIGTVPGLDDGADRSVTVQLPILGNDGAPLKRVRPETGEPDMSDPTVSGKHPVTRELGVVALMALAILTMYWSPSPPGYAPIAGDYKELHVRRIRFARQYLLGPEHTLPAWYPRELLGTPFWSNPQNFPFIPTRLLVMAVFDPNGPYAYTVAINLAAILAAVFTHLYCRRIGLTMLASAVAGWTFACCGFFASRIMAGHLPLLEAYAALPLALWCVESLASAHKNNLNLRRWTVALAVSSACAALAGHPQLTVYALFVAQIYALWCGGAKLAGRVFSAIVLGLGCAGFVLVPAMVLVQRSTRVLALARADNDVAMPYRRLLGFFIPSLDARMSVGPTGPHLRFPLVFEIWDTICYVGWTPWIAVALLVVLVLRRKAGVGRTGVAIAAVGIAGIVLALPWIHSLTARFNGTFLRSPARLIYLTEFALAMALGAAIHAVQRGALGKLARLLVPIALLAHLTDLRLHDLEFIASERASDKAQAAQIASSMWQQLGDKEGGARAAIDIDLPFDFNRRDVDDIGFFDSIILAKPYRAVLDLSNRPVDLNIQRLGGAELPTRALQAGGVKAVVTRIRRDDLPLAARIGEINVYGIPTPATRASFFQISQVRYLDQNEIHQRLRDPEQDVSSVLLLPRETSMPAEPTGTIASPATNAVNYRRPDPDHIECTVVSDATGYLRIVESYDPGWTATIDGSPAPVLAAMDALLCVRLAPGRHEVRFAYHTPGAGAGIVVSLISLGMLGGLLMFTKKDRSRVPSTGVAD